MEIVNDYPNIITIEIVSELQKISNLFELSRDNKIFLNRLIKHNEKNNHIYVENNIAKTLDNINEDLNKVAYTGKELKKIISDFKFNQYNYALLGLFKDIAESSYLIQESKDEKRLIDSVDIFTLLYMTKNLEEANEKNLLPDGKSLFYCEESFSSIFDNEEDVVVNPFLNFLNCFPSVSVRTESLIDKQSVDSLFYVD